MTLFDRSRRLAIGALAGLALVACSPAGSDTGATSPTSGTMSSDGFMAMGDPDAPVKIIEYASVTCGHCATFHEDAVPMLKERVEAGEVYFSFREFPTQPVPLAMAGFAMARCSGEDKYFDVIDDLMANQPGIFSAARNGQAETALKAIAARHGLDSEAFDACLADEDVRAAIIEVVREGEERGVNSTPSIYVNGRKLTRAADVTAAGLSAIIDAELGITPDAEADTPAPTPSRAAE